MLTAQLCAHLHVRCSTTECLTCGLRVHRRGSAYVRPCSQQIQVRDEQTGKRSRDNSQRMETAKISADIRASIVNLREQHDEMQKIHDENVRATTKGVLLAPLRTLPDGAVGLARLDSNLRRRCRRCGLQRVYPTLFSPRGEKGVWG